MGKRGNRIDRTLAILIALLIGLGVLIFLSAAFGPLARGATHISSVAFSHLALGVGMGIVLLFIASVVHYKTWQRFAPHIFILSLIATVLVFVPSLGFEHGGSKSWLIIANTSFQPSEALKIGAIFMTAAYFSMIPQMMGDIRYSLGGLFAILAGPVLLLLLQPDIGTLSIIIFAVLAIFLVAGARFRDIAIAVSVGLIAITILVMMRPYALDRVTTFLRPSENQQAEGYQLKQSLIAVGSGGVLGRGFGQSLQKFTYLPEPMGDSIFAIASEEFGFVGALTLIGLFLGLALRAYSIAARAADSFGAYLAVGIATYFTIQAFVNIGGILGVIPLTGIPLTFVSQGGSAMLIALFSAGVLLNISKYARRG